MRANTIYAGLIRLHVLHHASHEYVYGRWIIEELARHGYKLSPGTVYPLLHDMEESGYLTSEMQEVKRRYRRCYTTTPKGKMMLEEAKGKVQELFRELFDGDGWRESSPSKNS